MGDHVEGIPKPPSPIQVEDGEFTPTYDPSPARMILRNHTYLKVYKCWRILPILKTTTIKCLAIFFKKYFNFQGFYIVYIIIC